MGAITIGVAKTALPGIGILPVALFAGVLPARESTATLLVLLIVGDIVAISLYRTHADWLALRRLLPAVVVGIGIGAVVLALLDDALLRRLIGASLAFIAIASLARWRPAGAVADSNATQKVDTPTADRPSRIRTWTYGPLAGAMTMIANSAGPVMTIYFIASGMSVRAMLGTLGWFYFIINVAKVPFSVGIGLVSQDTLFTDLLLVPAVLVGAVIGYAIVRRISRSLFELIVYLVTLAAAVWLIIGA